MSWFTALYVLLVRLHPLFLGATCALSLCAALFFLRFYRRTHDRLFLFFSAAFVILGINRLTFVVVNAPAPEGQQVDQEPTFLYVVRLIAFLLILFAIIDKNRPRRPRTSAPR